MKKSSRLWWLHGAILLSAVIGCKNCGNSCGSPGGGAPMATGSTPYTGAPIASGATTMYSSNGVPSGYPGGASTTTGSAFPASSSAGYAMPGMSSGMTPSVGGVGR